VGEDDAADDADAADADVDADADADTDADAQIVTVFYCAATSGQGRH
jgi:hypothetical protein